uniref:Kelch protein 3 like n=1 Tax=Echinococcus granulosus TaxID=6210 RepID=A0A068WXN1_ECHGR|nr:kelch protein 3 like [Echinococcus granulosus]
MPHTQELHTSTFITLSICVDICLSPSTPFVGEQQPPHSPSGWVTLIEFHILRKRTHISSGSLRRGLRLPSLSDMPSARRSTSALNIPDIGIFVVGGQKREERLKSAEMLVEDPSGESGWRWIELSPMLEGREEPGIASINGCLVVAGGQEGQPKITVECLRLTSVEHPTAPQWTRLHEVDTQCLDYTSLVTFNNNSSLIMLSSSCRAFVAALWRSKTLSGL